MQAEVRKGAYSVSWQQLRICTVEVTAAKEHSLSKTQEKNMLNVNRGRWDVSELCWSMICVGDVWNIYLYSRGYIGSLYPKAGSEWSDIFSVRLWKEMGGKVKMMNHTGMNHQTETQTWGSLTTKAKSTGRTYLDLYYLNVQNNTFQTETGNTAVIKVVNILLMRTGKQQD